MATNIIIVIVVTSLATYLSRFLGEHGGLLMTDTNRTILRQPTLVIQ